MSQLAGNAIKVEQYNQGNKITANLSYAPKNNS